MPSEQGKCKKKPRRRIYANSCKICGKPHMRHRTKKKALVGYIGTFFAKWIPPKDLLDKSNKGVKNVKQGT